MGSEGPSAIPAMGGAAAGKRDLLGAIAERSESAKALPHLGDGGREHAGLAGPKGQELEVTRQLELRGVDPSKLLCRGSDHPVELSLVHVPEEGERQVKVVGGVERQWSAGFLEVRRHPRQSRGQLLVEGDGEEETFHGGAGRESLSAGAEGAR